MAESESLQRGISRAAVWQMLGVIVLAAAFLVSQWVYSQEQIQVGYTIVAGDSGSRVPVGSALLTYTNAAGVLVSQAGVGAVEAIRTGRIFVDEAGTQTALVLVNPSTQSASASLILRDASGREVARRSEILAPGQHLSRYMREMFGGVRSGFAGSLTFQSDQPLGAVTLRASQNGHGEPLYATLPVVDLGIASTSDAVVFPHLAVGGGYQTQLVLINRGTQRLQGRVRFGDSEGRPFVVQMDGNTVSELAYQIEPEGAYQAELDSATGLKVGYAVVSPDAGSSSPAGTAIFRFRAQEQLVTEAGIAATPATRSARIFVDHAASRTGVALANPGSQSAELTFVLMDRFGGVEATVKQTLPAGGHLAKFVQELFPGSLTEGFTGLLEIQSLVPVSPITLKLTTNARAENVLTTLPVADLARLPAAALVLFPQIVIGSGFSTRLVFIHADARLAAGVLRFFQSDGLPMVLPMGAELASQFNFQLPASSGRQFYPGDTARVASIQLIDPSTDQPTTEVAINEAGTVRPRFRIFDSSGQLRDDFQPAIQSLENTIARVESTGTLRGEQAGFATLTIAAGSGVTTATATVVRINSGVAGFVIKGVAQDRANRLYLAASTEHAVLLAQDVRRTPELYAGVRRNPGLKNGPRLESQFREPSYLTIDQSAGGLFVSDGANHVIRRVRPGTPGAVDTLTGTGFTGSSDGALTEASFNNPQGIALDGRGNLWVADSGNNTIRRINLLRRTVETIAGMPGTPGFADGRSQAARFRGPVGLAIETDTAVQAAARLFRGEPPPPVRVLVADTGNNVIRRVTEDGHVETLVSANVNAIRDDRFKSGLILAPASAPLAPLGFNAPTGLAFDPSGNIFVSETRTGQVRTILRNGAVVAATPPKIFTSPGGIAITRKGGVVVADGNRAAQEILYGEPEISGVRSDRIRDRGGTTVTIKGRNFAPDTLVIIEGALIRGAKVHDTQTISLTMPALPSGLTTLTVQNRGGLAQTSFVIAPVPIDELPSVTSRPSPEALLT